MQQHKTYEELVEELNKLKAELQNEKERSQKFEADLDELANRTPDCICVIDVEKLRITNCNAAVTATFGYTQDEFIGLDFESFVAPDYQELLMHVITKRKRILHKMKETSEYVDFIELVRKDGSLLQCEISATYRLVNEKAYATCIIRDISRSRSASLVSLRNERLLTDLQSISKTGGWEYDVETKNMYWTTGMYSLHELPVNSDIDHVAISLNCYLPEDQNKIIAAFKKCIEDGESYDLIFPFTTFKNNKRWIRTVTRPVYASHKIVKVIGSVMDITKQKATEERLDFQDASIKKVIQEIATLKGTDFFNRITLTLNEILKADYTFIGLLENENSIRTISFCQEGKILQNFAFPLVGRPSYQVTQSKTCAYEKNIQKLFPDAAELSEKDIEAYLGVPIFQKDGKTIGVIVALFKQEQSDMQHAKAMFELFALNISNEIERQHTDRHLANRDEEFMGLMEHFPFCTYVKDENLKHIYNNPHAKSFLPTDAAPNNTDAQVILDTKTKQMIENADRKILNGQSDSVELEYKATFDGKEVWFHDIKFGLTLSEGKKAVGGMTIDITEKKKSEQQMEQEQDKLEDIVAERTRKLQESNEEFFTKNQNLQEVNLKLQQEQKQNKILNKKLSLKNAELQVQKEQIESVLKKSQLAHAQMLQSEKMASLGVLVAGIAHEINNPINFINSNTIGLKRFLPDIKKLHQLYQKITPENYSEIRKQITEVEKGLSENELFELFADAINGIEVGTKRTTQIVKSLRSFARSNDNDQTVYDIQENIDNTLVILYHHYKHHVTIEKHYDEIPRIKCLPSQINQVWMNLLSNAVQAIEKTGKITIRTTVFDPETVRVSISDNGTGIPPNFLSRIFDPFYTTKDVGKGTGLGLSIVYNIIQDHNGKIDVKSKVGDGTTFDVYLPVDSTP